MHGRRMISPPSNNRCKMQPRHDDNGTPRALRYRRDFFIFDIIEYYGPADNARVRVQAELREWAKDSRLDGNSLRRRGRRWSRRFGTAAAGGRRSRLSSRTASSAHVKTIAHARYFCRYGT